MTEKTSIPVPQTPFILFSMGLPGYGGEAELWDVPKKKINIYHILVRIKHEMKLLRQRTGQDFYLFGTERNYVAPKKKIIANFGKKPIDILFTVNHSDLAKLNNIAEPNPAKIKRSSKGWRKMINTVTGKITQIPDEIHLWMEKSTKYYGLFISEFHYYPPSDERYLCGKHLFHYLQEQPVKYDWPRFAWGTLYFDPRRKSSARPRRILATAKVTYPYIYKIEE